MSIRNLPMNYGVALFPGFQALDVFGPIDALNNLALSHDIQLSVIAQSLDPVSTETHMNPNANCAQSIVPTHNFTSPPEKLDVLVVPVLDHSVHGGEYRGARGVLDERYATTNKMQWVWTTSQGPNVKWVSHARWIVDGNIWTSAGVSAGTDTMLAFIEHVYGAEDAETVADTMEYERMTDFATKFGLAPT
ncbi:class I glutamine amidotransferase-like protein [Hymenopellis radicata]|nr:class I glutamine amidotransferase-like protein [Hymenopellis radicata]